MPYLTGKIISGEFNDELDMFSIEEVKGFQVESNLTRSQVKSLYNYLKMHENDSDGQIITLDDQMLIPLSQAEIQACLMDLAAIN